MEMHVMVQADGVDVGVDATPLEQRRQAGAKAHKAIAVNQVAGLDAQAVADQGEVAAVALVNGKGKHTVEALDPLGTQGVPGLEDDFAVAG